MKEPVSDVSGKPRLTQRLGLPVARMLFCSVFAALMAFPVLAGSVNYTYDTLGRIKTATYSNGTVITYSYDAAGNRTSRVTTGVP